MADDDSQTARGATFSFVTGEAVDMGNPSQVFDGPTALDAHSLSLASDATPLRLSIPGELHFEILGTPTSEQLEEYARLIQSLIVVAQLAAGARSEA